MDSNYIQDLEGQNLVDISYLMTLCSWHNVSDIISLVLKNIVGHSEVKDAL